MGLPIILMTVLFFWPELVLNVETLKWGLDKSQIFKSWSWSKAEMDIKYLDWNERVLTGEFKNFCFDYEGEGLSVKSCFDELSWNFKIKNLTAKSLSPLTVKSKRLSVKTWEVAKKEKTPPPEVWRYWGLVWNSMVPDLLINFEEIIINEFKTNIHLTKMPRKLTAEIKPVLIHADPDLIEARLPEAYPLPKKIKSMDQLYLRNVVLKLRMKEDGIPIELMGALESIQLKISAYADLPLKDNFKKDVLLTTKANIHMPGFKKNLSHYMPDPFKELPAPFNVMDGFIDSDHEIVPSVEDDVMLVKGVTKVNLTSPKQALIFQVRSGVPIDAETYRPGEIGIDLNFEKVLIQLPRLSKKSPPPQFMPDSRIKKGPLVEQKKESVDLNLHVKALNENSMSFKTDLLDEVLRLNFDLKVIENELQSGFVKALPLKSKIFKRPIYLKDFLVEFKAPLSPVLKSTILFPLPEYKITLELEGPISKPRYAFSSSPPLPQNDIYAVLLFGRPLADLDPEDKTAAQKTNQLLSKGILSLSVLYFLAGSPVEYVGFDPDSKNATAQFGLGNKTSLRVGGGQEGLNSSGIRRSLGKGWYLDTSVQNNTDTSSNQVRNYGVLLERIIAY